MYLGIDIGTSSVKALLIDDNQTSIDAFRHSYIHDQWLGKGQCAVLTVQRDPGRSGHLRGWIMTPEIALKNNTLETA